MRSPTVPLVTAFTCLTIVAGTARAQNRAPEPVRPVDWTALADESVRTLSDYLKVNTTNPPGNEIAGARFLAAILEREGIEARILDSAALGSGRVNLYARLKGDGSKKAIALVQHIDVVPADARFWTVDPFSGAIQDGYVWGRGAFDMKGEGIVHLMAMIAIKRSGVPLTRDIVFTANASPPTPTRSSARPARPSSCAITPTCSGTSSTWSPKAASIRWIPRARCATTGSACSRSGRSGSG